ncbi:hypothetical protein Tco_0527383 [Tanacetum coccineum]
MKDVFVSVENDLDETFKQNELLKDQLLEASLAEDIKNLVITSCVEIRNKDLHDETERISKESKDVSNESKTADTVCNDAFEVTHELSKRIIELEMICQKFAAKEYCFEIALQHMKSRVLIDDVVRSLSAPIYCRDLDMTPLRDLIDSEASMQDLYDRMGRMEIRQEAIERMEYRQSYHWDRYQGVFEHMAGVYSVPLQGAYNPHGYAQP